MWARFGLSALARGTLDHPRDLACDDAELGVPCPGPVRPEPGQRHGRGHRPGDLRESPTTETPRSPFTCWASISAASSPGASAPSWSTPSWRSIFLFEVPLEAFCFVFIAKLLQPTSRARRGPMFDFRGFILLLFWSPASSWHSTRFQKWEWQTSSVSGSSGLGVLAPTAFLVREFTARDLARPAPVRDSPVRCLRRDQGHLLHRFLVIVPCSPSTWP